MVMLLLYNSNGADTIGIVTVKEFQNCIYGTDYQQEMATSKLDVMTETIVMTRISKVKRVNSKQI